MSKPRAEISPAAIEDLVQIQSFTARTFGEHRSRIYLDDLHKAIKSLVDHPHLGQATTFRPGEVRELIVGMHVVRYQFKTDCISIVRVIHQRSSVPHQPD